jgi:predicted TIM-barrel fold metal-dependent hydrolase
MLMSADPEASLPLDQYVPRSKLVLPQTHVERPRFPVIDAHNHFGETFGGGWINRPVSELIDVMDEADVRVIVDLDGGWGETVLERHLDRFRAAHPDRFIHFGGVDWSRWPDHGDGFGEWAAARLHDQVRRGAQGLKIWKPFGLSVRDHRGDLVAVDDRRLDPVWATAAEQRIPVIIHVADPVAFFDPLDSFNERWEELHAHPDWHFPSPPFPSFASIIEAFARLILDHPQTTFIGAHVGCYPENLAWVGELLDRAPNLFVDIAARISELGRQPYTARRFFLRYANRILFGTDNPPDPAIYRLYYRFLETGDEYFNYSPERVPPQGRWTICGLHLPDDVLSQVYSANARRLFGIAARI